MPIICEASLRVLMSMFNINDSENSTTPYGTPSCLSQEANLKFVDV